MCRRSSAVCVLVNAPVFDFARIASIAASSDCAAAFTFASPDPLAADAGGGVVPDVPVAAGFVCSLPLVPAAPLAALAGFDGFDVDAVAAAGGIEPAAEPPAAEVAEPVDISELGELVAPAGADEADGAVAAFSNSFRCVLTSTSFARIAGSS